jgi:uncharacterized protein YqfA (UPF0365 family)
MKIKETPQAGSYEAALTNEQRTEFHTLLLSGITLARAQAQALPWPDGPEKGNKPSISSLGKIRARLRIEERVSRIEEEKAITRATQTLLKSMVNKTDQEMVLDQAMTLIGQQVIEASLELNGPTSNTAAAWLLLRRADQRRSDRRTAIFEAQAEKAAKSQAQPEAKPATPVLSAEEKERRWRQIFGMQPL